LAGRGEAVTNDPRLYVDEDAMHRGLIAGLRARGVDVLTVYEAGLLGQDDETQLTFAASQQRVLYTFNVGDFCRLHGEFLQDGREHAGIIVVPRQQYSVGEQIRRLLAVLTAFPGAAMRNRLEFL
jgi:hypothetical protein